ncbi:MAG: ABC transporter ATP-binding protein [Xanthobacteraceae bacterium]
MTVAPKLSVAGLCKGFDDLNVLDRISLDVTEGEFVCIVGPSGCGKTTFLRILGGLEIADEGRIEIGGHPIKGPGADRGFVFQADSLLPWRRVLSNAAIGLEINKRNSPAERSRTRQLLELVGLKGFDSYYPRQLSGGMRQRVNLARALCIDPEVLLMDEPFSGLDAQTREIMQTELLRIWTEGRKTVLFITHQIDEAVYLADRVIVFGRRPGRIQDVVPIDLPRPRDLSIKRDARFAPFVDRIWKRIEYDVRESVRLGEE